MSAGVVRVGATSFAARRQRFMESIGSHAAALFVAAPVAVRSNDVEFPYRQDNDLLYLSGFCEPESAVLLLPGHPDGEFHMFVRPRDRERETWTGRRAGVEGAREQFGADVAHPIEELAAVLPKLAAEREQFYFSFGRSSAINQQALHWMQQWQHDRARLGKGPRAIVDPGPIVHEMRLHKHADEVEQMRTAAAIAGAAHVHAMRSVRPGMREYEVEAQVDFDFRRQGASGAAYPSIVAGGENATILHYVDNDAELRDGSLLLIDAGAEFDGYCSDITRTFPVGRTFSAEQRALYEIVLRAQKAAIDTVRPGVAFDELHRVAVEILTAGLIELGLLAGDLKAAVEAEHFRPYYMHRTSHWLGLDVHDVGEYRLDDAARPLAAGMVLTIEPGLYVANDAEGGAIPYRGIGIRIEDDVLVTEEGHETLSADVPKEIDAIEALRASAFA